ncbi:MAG: hypothetical protein KDD19_20345 [Phaeodactylibacter sp.]|nr:hypothetical protein [Phaeodactylibacter sp.]MCB9053531.1 hypothetical protein [Lewinellaceae bacterium]
MVFTLHPLRNLTIAFNKAAFLAEHTVRANIVLGLASKNCAGHGVCKILAYDEPGEFSCQQAQVVIEIDAKKRLRMLFREEGACPCIVKNHFAGDNFLVEEPFHLPPWLCSQLDVGACCVPAGRYTLKIRPSFFIVEFF